MLNPKIYPPGDYHIHEIYEIMERNVIIPQSHLDYRHDATIKLYRNYIHSILPTLERTENFQRNWHRFS